MGLNWALLAERRMIAAEAAGELSHLAGEGRRLPDAPPTTFVEPSEAIGMRMMAEAGYMPQEIVLRKRLEGLHQEWREAEEAEAKQAIMGMIARLEMEEAIARESRLHLMRHH